jgi:ABC-type amino acid transport substrate-binding protein
MAHEVFISHSNLNKSVADAICAKAEAAGVRCWIAPRDVLAGKSYPSEIIRGIENAKLVVFVLSSHSNNSGHVSKELERAFSNGKVIVPFRIEDVSPSGDIEYFLAGQHWLDAINPPMEERITELVGAIMRHLGDPSEFTFRKTRGEVRKEIKPVKISKRSLVLLTYTLVLPVLLVAGAWGAWRQWAHLDAQNATELVFPADDETIIGSLNRYTVELSFTLPPDRMDEEAEIELLPDGKKPVLLPAVAASSFTLPEGMEGHFVWCVRAVWRDHPGAEFSHGPWSQKRSFSYYGNRLNKILLTGHCVIGTADLTATDKITNLNPATGNPGGFEVDLLQAFFDEAARSAGAKSRVTIDHMGAADGWGDTYFHMLQADKQVDMLVSGITPTAEREKNWEVRFSEPSLKFCDVLFVRAGTKPVENGQITINKIGVSDKTTNKDFILRYFATDPSRVLVAPLPKPYYTLHDWLLHDRIDGMLIDALYVPTLRQDFPDLATGTDVVDLDPRQNSRFEYSSTAYALRPEDDVLITALNDYLTRHVEERKALCLKYFPNMLFFQ